MADMADPDSMRDLTVDMKQAKQAFESRALLDFIHLSAIDGELYLLALAKFGNTEAASRWFCYPQPELDGLNPWEVLEQGQRDRILAKLQAAC